MTGGLGRTLADIRADIDSPSVRGLVTVPEPGALGMGPIARLVRDAARFTEGADDTDLPEFGTPTPEQFWARLLTLEPAVRLAAIGRLLVTSDAAHECWTMNHADRYRQLEARHRELMQAVSDGKRVEILHTDDDGPVAWMVVVPDETTPTDQEIIDAVICGECGFTTPTHTHAEGCSHGD